MEHVVLNAIMTALSWQATQCFFCGGQFLLKSDLKFLPDSWLSDVHLMHWAHTLGMLIGVRNGVREAAQACIDPSDGRICA